MSKIIAQVQQSKTESRKIGGNENINQFWSEIHNYYLTTLLLDHHLAAINVYYYYYFNFGVGYS
jgi:hypothetical protein